MLSRTALRGILRTDGLRLVRSRFLLGTTVYIFAIAAALRWALPWIGDTLAERVEFDLVPWYPLIGSHFVVGLAGLLAGIIGGFLLLEGREDRTVKALLVSPVPLGSYLAVICVAVFLLASVLSVVQGLIVGVGLPPWPALLGASFSAAPAAVFVALVISACADSKTEALVVMKICAFGPLIPSAAYFLAEPWQWLAAVYPPYWAAKAYWVAEAGGSSWPLWIVGGLPVSALWGAALVRVYLRAARR